VNRAGSGSDEGEFVNHTRRELLLGLAAAPAVAAAKWTGPYAKGVAPDRQPIVPAKELTVGGLNLNPAKPPSAFQNRTDVGLLVPDSMSVQMIHAWPRGNDFVGEARSMIAPNGDYLVMFAGGAGHYLFTYEKRNDMICYRSKDRGKTWSGPVVPWHIDYNQHGLVPLTPRGSKRIFAFGTEPRLDVFDGNENCPIGCRSSDDNGLTWTPVKFIRPMDFPELRGMFVMRMCESGRGSWFLAPHEAKWHHQGVDSFLYLVRSDDRGESWVVAPGPRPRCWTELKYRRLEEGRPINYGDAGVFVLIRTATGFLWSMRSEDDGKTWSDPEPTPLVHPSAPPMIFHLSDGQTLAAFHHNRYAGVLREEHQLVGNVGQDRSEIWVSKSRDGGRTWSEPRFVFANAAEAGNEQQSAWAWSVSYLDAQFEKGLATIFCAHQHKRLHVLQFQESLLDSLPTRAELRKLA
jgi:hypothetical protein